MKKITRSLVGILNATHCGRLPILSKIGDTTSSAYSSINQSIEQISIVPISLAKPGSLV